MCLVYHVASRTRPDHFHLVKPSQGCQYKCVCVNHCPNFSYSVSIIFGWFLPAKVSSGIVSACHISSFVFTSFFFSINCLYILILFLHILLLLSLPLAHPLSLLDFFFGADYIHLHDIYYTVLFISLHCVWSRSVCIWSDRTFVTPT